MNKYLLIKLLFLIALSCDDKDDFYFNNKYYQQNINPTEWFDGMNPKRLTNLKGNITEIVHFTFMPNSMNESEFKFNSGTNSYGLFFNEKGEIIKENGFSDIGVISFTAEYYDFFDGIIDNYSYYDKKGNIVRKEKFTLNEKNIPVHQELFNGDTTINTNLLVYNAIDTTITRSKWFEFIYRKGKLIDQTSISGHVKWVYDYYQSGKRKYKCSYEKKLPIIEEKYNENGLIIEVNHFFYDSTNTNNETSKYVHYYEGNSKIKTDELQLIDGLEFLSIVEYEYDENEKLIHTFRTSNNSKEKVGYIEYNSHGDILIQKNGNEKTKFENYKYDNKNNWIEREQWINEKLFYKFSRKIKYE